MGAEGWRLAWARTCLTVTPPVTVVRKLAFAAARATHVIFSRFVVAMVEAATSSGGIRSDRRRSSRLQDRGQSDP